MLGLDEKNFSITKKQVINKETHRKTKLRPLDLMITNGIVVGQPAKSPSVVNAKPSSPMNQRNNNGIPLQ